MSAFSVDGSSGSHGSEDVEDDEEGGGGGLGALFDSFAHRIGLKFDFPGGEGDDIDRPDTSLVLYTIGQDPGHLQSGHYLWPAASFAATYLNRHWGELGDLVGANKINNRHQEGASSCGNSNNSHDSSGTSASSQEDMDITPRDSGSPITRVLELGSGCGLAGLSAARQRGVQDVYLSDYDHGCLDLLRQNVKHNFPSCVPTTNPNRMSEASTVTYPRLLVEFLRWGSHLSNDWGNFDLIVGSDLLYCVGVVQPLLDTVAFFLARGGVFVLTSSFRLTEDIIAEVTASTARLGLVMQTKIELDEKQKQCAVQYFGYF